MIARLPFLVSVLTLASLPAYSDVCGTTEGAHVSMPPLKAIDYSHSKVVLLSGGGLDNLTAVSKYLCAQGIPTTIVSTDAKDGPLNVESGQFAVIANGQFGGIWGQYAIDVGIAGDIEVFARKNGVPIVDSEGRTGLE